MIKAPDFSNNKKKNTFKKAERKELPFPFFPVLQTQPRQQCFPHWGGERNTLLSLRLGTQ